jgi:hypothetical protein
MNRKLLSLAVCGLLVHAVPCAWGAEPQTEQDRAVAAIKKVGGRVQFDENGSGKHVLGVSFKDRKVTDAALQHIKQLATLRSLDLNATDVSDAGLEHLKGLLDLRELKLRKTKVTDAGLEHLKGLTNLRSLYLTETRITDAGLKVDAHSVQGMAG